MLALREGTSGRCVLPRTPCPAGMLQRLGHCPTVQHLSLWSASSHLQASQVNQSCCGDAQVHRCTKPPTKHVETDPNPQAQPTSADMSGGFTLMYLTAAAQLALTLQFVVVGLWHSCVGLVAASWTHTLIPNRYNSGISSIRSGAMIPAVHLICARAPWAHLHLPADPQLPGIQATAKLELVSCLAVGRHFACCWQQGGKLSSCCPLLSLLVVDACWCA